MAGEILSAVEGFLERDIHPTVIVGAYFKALDEIVKITESLGVRTHPYFVIKIIYKWLIFVDISLPPY